MNARDWLDAYAQRLGVAAPTGAEFSIILDIAAEAAHASERVAAPAACWLVARSDMQLEEALAHARALAQKRPND